MGYSGGISSTLVMSPYRYSTPIMALSVELSQDSYNLLFLLSIIPHTIQLLYTPPYITYWLLIKDIYLSYGLLSLTVETKSKPQYHGGKPLSVNLQLPP